jgi:hypothetical protein
VFLNLNSWDVHSFDCHLQAMQQHVAISRQYPAVSKTASCFDSMGRPFLALSTMIDCTFPVLGNLGVMGTAWVGILLV